MKGTITFALAAAMLLLLGCGNDSGTGPANEDLTVDTLLTGLQYPLGLWVAGGAVYYTETNGRNTMFGGAVDLRAYVLAAHRDSLIVDNPVNCDAVVVAHDGRIFLTSHHGAFPGDFGKVSVVDPVTKAETHVVDIAIASVDMYISPADDIFIIGASETPDAKSVYRLPAGSYNVPEVLYTGLGLTQCLSLLGDIVYYSNPYAILRFVGTRFDEFFPKSVKSISFSSAYLFYADEYNGTIGRVNVSTKKHEILLTGLHSPCAVRWSSTSRRLYFLEAGTAAGEFKNGTLQFISGILLP